MTWPQIARRGAAALLALAACAFLVDYAVLRVRMLHATPTMPVESMIRHRLLAIPMKNGLTTYEPDEAMPTDTLTCVHALFPHLGYGPCWYVKPRVSKPIPIN